MSVRVYVHGVIPADAAFKTALAAWNACLEAKVDPPDDLYDQLGVERGTYAHMAEINPEGAEVELRLSGDVEYDDGATLDLASLPKGVTKLRIFMS